MRNKKFISLVLINSGVLLFIVNWILSREMNICANFTSDYVHTNLGVLSTLGFILTGIGIVLFSIYPHIKIPTSYFSIYGISFLLLGFFPDDLVNQRTVIGLIHLILATICLLSFLVIVFVLFVKGNGYRSAITISVYALSIIGFVFMQIDLFKLVGIYQRVFIFSEIALFEILIIQRKLD